MSHYTKLAVVGIRLIAFVSLLLGVIGLIYAAVLTLITKDISNENWGRVFSSFPYLLAGLVAYFLANPIGRLLGRKL